MSSFITAVIGIIAMLGALFVAFSAGMEAQKDNEPIWAIGSSLALAAIAVLLLLVRS